MPVEINVLAVEQIIIFFLLVIAITTWIGNRLPIPYTVGLVVAGLILAVIPAFDVELPELTSELILALFLPPILFQAAYQLHTHELRTNFSLIALLVTVGVLLTTVIVAVIIALLNPVMGLLLAAVFGALISAIDPVAVIALFNENSVSARLETLIEGESLLNDGTAIVIFAIVLQAAQSSGELSIITGLLDFVRVAFGGALVGGIIGYLMARLLYHIDDPMVEMMLTTCLVFGSYLVSEQLHVSGVLAVVAAGLMHGYTGFDSMSHLTQQTVNTVWAYLAAVANAAIFLLIGLSINLQDIVSHLPLTALAIFAVLVSRIVIVYGLIPLHTRIFDPDRPLPLSWQHIMFWGGQRGGVSLALALSLPFNLPQRASILVMTFGVVLFTSLVQATSMPWVIQRLGLRKDQWQGDQSPLPLEDLQ